MNRETPLELAARSFFEHVGYVVSRIPEANDDQRADYSIENAGERLIAEVKSRGPDEEFERQMERVGRASSEQSFGRANPISRQIREASGQLAATFPENPSWPRILVLVAAGDNPDLQVEQFRATLYGTIHLLRAGGVGAVAIPCFYFTFNDFYRFRDIDAAVVLTPRGALLWLNAFGKRRDRVRETTLFKKLSAVGAVTDPDLLERAGEAFLVDTDMDRRDEDVTLAHVRSKYGHPELITFKPKNFRAAVQR